jgi:hypothetical protein
MTTQPIDPANVEKAILGRLKGPNVCFLFGAGSSKSVGYPLMSELTRIAATKAQTSYRVSGALSALTGSTIEEQLEELLGQLRSPRLSQLSEDTLRETVDHILDVIFDECSKPAPLDVHRAFVRAVFQRMNDRKHIHTFTTNYDMLFEWAADSEMAHCVNGFVGVQSRTFDPSQFEVRPTRFVPQARGAHARLALCPSFYLYKLHGSVSWLSDNGNVREIQIVPAARRRPGQLMVFPTPQKQKDTCQSPYADIFTRMGEILNRKQTVLVTLGFGFGDMHIKALIEQCLKDNTFILVVLSKDISPTFDSFLGHKNALLVTEKDVVIDGVRYKSRSDLWDFTRFVELFSRS